MFCFKINDTIWFYVNLNLFIKYFISNINTLISKTSFQITWIFWFILNKTTPIILGSTILY